MVTLSLVVISLSCDSGRAVKSEKAPVHQPKSVKKTRADGTLSSVSQVDSANFAHGIRVNYYKDGKTIHSKITFNHGVKHGPAIHYYQNGQIFEHTGFSDGKRYGLTRKYHKNGQLAAQFEYENDKVLPGLVEYHEDGSLVTSYPEVIFTKTDKLAFENTVYLKISCTKKSARVKYYYVLDLDNGKQAKSYLEAKNGISTLQYIVYPGDILMKTIELYAEIPTEMGNTLVKKYTYHLSAKNMK